MMNGRPNIQSSLLKVTSQELAIGLQMKCYTKQEFIHCRFVPACPKKTVQLYTILSRRLLKKQLKLGQIVVSSQVIGYFILAKRSLARLLLTTSAYVPELQKLSGTVATKAAGKPRKQASKKKGGDEAEDNDDDEDGVGDEPTNEEEESTKITKPKKGGNPRGRGRKPPMKRKAKESDDDDDDDDSGGNNDGSSEEDDEDLTEKGRKVKTNTSNKQAKTVKTSKRPVSSQDGKKPKRAK
ncbi:hypothetical protein ES332_A10G079200v1 [Gossypium tomentosum]|uniref:Uncharacterized protein n=1 Tax=Gossypium tomentosum TaxID=34277 RepID=A0A5D2NMB2_GOSTO|nr:hypothetical protein ES332_A10G079200v1 [Gossypium tomentosum]